MKSEKMEDIEAFIMSPIKDVTDSRKQDFKIIKHSMEEDEIPTLQNKAKPSLIS